MVDFADIGRADPVGTIQGWQAKESDLATARQNRAVQDLNMQQTKQNIGIKQRKLDNQIQQQQKLDMPRPLELLKMQFEGGGAEGTAGGWALDLARTGGLIDMSQGGEGTITQRNQMALEEILKTPRNAQKMSRMRLGTAREQVAATRAAVEKKPDDPKARQAFQEAAAFLTQTIWKDKALSEELERGKGAQAYTLKPGERRFTGEDKLVAQGSPKQTGTGTTAIKEYEYGLTNPDFAKAQAEGISSLSQEEINLLGAKFNYDGKMPSLGRGKESTKARLRILKSAAKQALGADLPEGGEDQTPSEVALDIIGKQADTKAIQGSLNFLEKQLGSMGSFVENIGFQVDRVNELSKDLKTFDARLLNIPLRAFRGKIIGSPEQAKYDMFLTEIESEIGKLATGSSASIAELSATAQEKWAKIHDKNLSINDMLELLEETKHAAKLRARSVSNQLSRTRKKMKTREYGGVPISEAPQAPPNAVEFLKANPQHKDAFKAKYGYVPEGL